MIVTIDGPAGAGKSSAARALAQRLQFRFLDTGAMYRAVTLAASRRGLDWSDAAALAQLARQLNIEIQGNRTLLDGADVSEEIRARAITSLTHYAADNPAVRVQMVELQRRAAGRDNIVTEGRDQGTVVFPAAECKIFLTASAEERARRRLRDLEVRGEKLELQEVLAEQDQRDRRDAARDVGPLVAARDAIVFETDGLSAAEVVDRLEALVRSRMP